jgi:hypothetical protein
VGKGSKGTEASSSGSSENDGLDTCEAHHVGVSPQEDRGGAAGAVGEGEGWEEGGVGFIRGCREYVAGFLALRSG